MHSFATSMFAAVVVMGTGVAQGALLVDFNDRGWDFVSPTLTGWEAFDLGPGGQGADGTHDVYSPVTRSFAGGIDVTVSPVGTAGPARLRDGNYDPGPANAGSFTQANMMRDFVSVSHAGSGDGMDILVEGLVPNAEYHGRIWSWDFGASTAGLRADWFVNGEQVVDDWNVVRAAPANNTDNSFAFSTTANANGEIVIQGRRDAASAGGASVLINGLQLTLVPEPASAMLIGLGATCLLIRRSRS